MVPRAPTPNAQSYLRPDPPSRGFSTISKSSNRSHSSSLADDERSDSEDEDMGPDIPREHRVVPPQYAGEDTRLTSRKELAGWYAYGFAAEVFVICGIGKAGRFNNPKS